MLIMEVLNALSRKLVPYGIALLLIGMMLLVPFGVGIFITELCKTSVNPGCFMPPMLAQLLNALALLGMTLAAIGVAMALVGLALLVISLLARNNE